MIRNMIFALFFAAITILYPCFPIHAADCSKAKEFYQKTRSLGDTVADLVQKEQCLEKAIELCPSYGEAHNDLGDVYEKQGRFEDAIARYKKAVELKPDVSYPYFGLGDIYYKTNRYKEAVAWYEKGLAYDPKDKLSLDRLAISRDVLKGKVIKAETITRMLATTRGPGDIVPITFGEGLIPFDYNKSTISADAKPQLNEIGKALSGILGSKKNVGIYEKDRSLPVIEISGHADTRGADEYNLTLSRKRAEAVSNYLITQFNFPKGSFKAVGFGKRMPLCSSDSSEACHSLNRRVEIVKKTAHTGGETRGTTRSASLTSSVAANRTEPKITVEAGFFYQKKGSKAVKVLTEDVRLVSRRDRYFIFFRPLQDCYVYIMQEDGNGDVSLLFPDKNRGAPVKKGYDYWVPAPFGKAFTLDDAKGEEKLYLLVTSWSLQGEMENLSPQQGTRGEQTESISLKEQVKRTVRSLKTRSIEVVQVAGASQGEVLQGGQAQAAPAQHISEDELIQQPNKINMLLERIEGEGGWVKAVRFRHE